MSVIEEQNKQLFVDPTKITTATNTNTSLANTTATFNNKNSFASAQNTNQGNNSFIKKWGDRPNVDNWRRKTSIQLTKALPTTIDIDKSTQNTPSVDKEKKETKTATDTTTEVSIQLLENIDELDQSILKWNTANLQLARIFLYELNDFEKAFPRYKVIIDKQIDAATTENALLDIASHYIHIGESSKSDSIIALITDQFPDGTYLKKKRNKEKVEALNKNSSASYQESYFLAQIGDWDNFSAQMEKEEQLYKGTKWNTPYQFLKVKMYAQLRMDSAALALLDQLVVQNLSEPIKAKAKNIITEINNRKETEQYLQNLKIVKITKPTIQAEAQIVEPKKMTAPIKKDTSTAIIVEETNNQLVFTQDSLEQHYIALQTMNVSAVFVKEIQNALKDVHAEEFRKQNLVVTFVQFTDQSYIVWIGPFVNAAEGIQYVNKIKPRLSTEIISFIPKNQYDLTLIGKSNIIQINNQSQLDQYRRDKANYYFKP